MSPLSTTHIIYYLSIGNSYKRIYSDVVYAIAVVAAALSYSFAVFFHWFAKALKKESKRDEPTEKNTWPMLV